MPLLGTVVGRKVENHFDKNNRSARANILSVQYLHDLVLESDVLLFFRSLQYVLLATTSPRMLAPCLCESFIVQGLKLLMACSQTE